MPVGQSSEASLCGRLCCRILPLLFIYKVLFNFAINLS